MTMFSERLILPAAAVILAGLLAGCGSSANSIGDTAGSDEALLGDLLGDIDLTEGGPNDDGQQTPDHAAPVPLTIPGQRLELRLTAGDRFPLVKTVEQTLVQKSSQFPATAESRLELHMDIQVEEVHPEAVLMTVLYTRVAFRHDVNGQSSTYDSTIHSGSLPVPLIPYAGMVNNGFSFWLGRDNRIRELVGYETFLERCVQQVPDGSRERLLAELQLRFRENGVASFVDDTIGLLPFAAGTVDNATAQVAVGDEWMREYHYTAPVPMTLKSTCRLLTLNEDTAEIDITGRLTPNTNSAQANDNHAAGVNVSGGRMVGSCVVDRTTGLPLQLNRTQYLNMTVELNNGQVVEQEKQVKTTIQSYRDSGAAVVKSERPAAASTGSDVAATRPSIGQTPVLQPNIRLSSGTQSGKAVSPIPTQVPGRSLQSTTRAVYPD